MSTKQGMIRRGMQRLQRSALKAEGLAQPRREGKIVFYSLTEAGAHLYAQASVGAIREPLELVVEER